MCKTFYKQNLENNSAKSVSSKFVLDNYRLGQKKSESVQIYKLTDICSMCCESNVYVNTCMLS